MVLLPKGNPEGQDERRRKRKLEEAIRYLCDLQGYPRNPEGKKETEDRAYYVKLLRNPLIRREELKLRAFNARNREEYDKALHLLKMALEAEEEMERSNLEMGPLMPFDHPLEEEIALLERRIEGEKRSEVKAGKKVARQPEAVQPAEAQPVEVPSPVDIAQLIDEMTRDVVERDTRKELATPLSATAEFGDSTESAGDDVQVLIQRIVSEYQDAGGMR